MAKRQCEIEVDDSGSLDEITNSQGTKRRRTSPKEEALKEVGDVQEGGRDPRDCVMDTKAKDESKPCDVASKEGANIVDGENGQSSEAQVSAGKQDPASGDIVATPEQEPTTQDPPIPKELEVADLPAATPVDDGKRRIRKSTAAVREKKSATVPATTQDLSGSVPVGTQKDDPKPKAPVTRSRKAATPIATSKSSRGAKDPLKPQSIIKLADLCKEIVELPEDVIHVICGKLPPLYLVTLRGSCRRLRDILNKPTPWMESRAMAYGAPAPPEGVTEWRWAAALWGNECDLCGARSDSLQEGVDFYVARRHCKGCKWMDKARVIAFPSTEIDKHYPDCPKELFEYTFHTPVQALLPLKNSNHKQFWHVDVRSVIAEWDKFQKGISAGEEDAAGLFEEWKDWRKRMIASRFAMAKAYEKWKDSVTKCDQGTRVQHLKSRLHDLGFKRGDVDVAITAQSVAEIRSPPILFIKGSPDVTAAEWKKFRPVLEPLVEAEQAARLRQHLSGVLNGQYLEYILTRPPSESCAYPPLAAFAGSAALSYLLPDDPMLKPTSEDLTPFLKVLPHLVDRYWGTKKDVIRQTLLGLSSRSKGYSRAHELAKHVFVCADFPSTATGRRKDLTVCIGWRSAARHMCLGEWDEMSAGVKSPGLTQNHAHHKPRRDNVLSSHAYGLIRMAGEDPESATVARMDELDPYYICESDGGESSNKARKVYSWRGALHCVLEDRNAGFSPASEGVAEKARAAAVTIRERASVWSCNHCYSEDGKLKADTKSGIIKHLQVGHKISSPKVVKDYFLNQDLLHLCEVGYEVSSGGTEVAGTALLNLK